MIKQRILEFITWMFKDLKKPLYTDWIFWMYVVITVAVLGAGPAGWVVGIPFTYIFFLLVPTKIRKNKSRFLVNIKDKYSLTANLAQEAYSKKSRNTTQIENNKRLGQSKMRLSIRGNNEHSPATVLVSQDPHFGYSIADLMLGLFTLGLSLLVRKGLNSRAKKRWSISRQISYRQDSVTAFEKFMENITKLNSEIPPRFNIISFDNVKLAESREGTRVTHTSGTYKGRTSGNIVSVRMGRFGFADSEATTKGRTKSTSISGPAPEEITVIDVGKVILESSLIAFAGEKYTRSALYSDIINWRSTEKSISISVLGGEKNWDLVFVNESDVKFIEALLEIVGNEQNRSLSPEILKKLSAVASSEVAKLKRDIGQLESL